MSTSAVVRVQITVDVCVGSWDHKTNFNELRTQVLREAQQKLENRLAKDGHEFKVKEATGVSITLNADVKGGAPMPNQADSYGHDEGKQK